MKLNGKWKLSKVGTKQYVEAYVPGSIYKDLLDNALMEDPFYRYNEYKIRDIMNDDFEYHKQFIVEKSQLDANEIELIFHGIDTISSIYLNDVLIGKTDNMHRTYRFDVKNNVQLGENQLRVIIHSPIKAAKEKKDASSYDLHRGWHQMYGYNYIRKCHSMYGWDWGPQLPDGGVWKDVELKFISHTQLNTVDFFQHHQKQRVDVCVDIRNKLNESRDEEILLTVYDPFHQMIHCVNQNILDQNQFNITIENPLLWWPLGYGKQYLYRFELCIKKDCKIVDKREYHIGLKTLELKREKDQYGESFTFVLNGVEIFLKGANYIPEDSLVSRYSKEKTEALIKYAVSANHNTIRVWGGGIYPPDYFYEICDQYGVLVWQDLMFACAVYDYEDKAFQETTEIEIEQNIRRIKHHPCIILICGNNEIETMVANWDIPSREKSKALYQLQFEERIPSLVNKICTEIPYWNSSPSSGTLFENVDSDDYGDMHYWGVWHGNEPITHYRNHYPRMMSEFGIQSFPSMKTIHTFTEKGDLNIFSYVMESHQKNASANGKILNYISQLFRYPKDLKSLVVISQLIQAEGVRYGVEHWRRNHGRCMGTIYWQLNDCWPVASWSSIDYFHRLKALYYLSKRFYAPILVSGEENENHLKVHVTNDTLSDFNGKVIIDVFNLEGKKKSTEETTVFCEKVHSSLVFEVEYEMKLEDKWNTIVRLKLVNPNNQIVSTNYVQFAPYKHLQLKNPNITYHILEDDEGFIMQFKSKCVAKFVSIDFKSLDLVLSDNYFDLIPDEEKIVVIEKKQHNIKEIEENIMVSSLFDTYE